MPSPNEALGSYSFILFYFYFLFPPLPLPLPFAGQGHQGPRVPEPLAVRQAGRVGMAPAICRFSVQPAR